MSNLSDEWKRPLQQAFEKYIPIVIGYGGGDHTLMSFLENEALKLENIYYESNSSVLTKNATRELDRLVLTLKRYPSMIVEIRSHTDTRGNASENQALSQRRANEVVRYLTKKGIDERRLRGIGKGESLPVNKCSDGVQCTETEHQRNRRTEFRILQIEKIG